MSEHEKRLSDLIGRMSQDCPGLAHDADVALDALLAEQKAAGLEEAMAFFKKKQGDTAKARLAAKSLTKETIADMKKEEWACDRAAHMLHKEANRRKKEAKG